jgi:quinol monooxygenase YgiN
MLADMNSKTVTVTALVKAQRGKESQVRQALLSLISPSRGDAGCLSYDLHQTMDNPTAFLFYENWASKELLDAHLQTPHVQGAMAKMRELVAEPPQITLWEKIG